MVKQRQKGNERDRGRENEREGERDGVCHESSYVRSSETKPGDPTKIG